MGHGRLAPSRSKQKALKDVGAVGSAPLRYGSEAAHLRFEGFGGGGETVETSGPLANG